MKQRKKIISIIAIVMAILMAFSLIASVLPTAFAISQSDIDALQKKKDELSARVAEAEERVNTLKNEQANVLDWKSIAPAFVRWKRAAATISSRCS